MKNEFKTECKKHEGRNVNVKVIIELQDEDKLKQRVEEMVENYNAYYGYVDYNDLHDDIIAMIKDHLKVHCEAVKVDNEENL